MVSEKKWEELLLCRPLYFPDKFQIATSLSIKKLDHLNVKLLSVKLHYDAQAY
jgi:hypothetical protein